MELTKKQTEQLLSNFLGKENGLNEVLEMVLNSMMYCERQVFLSQKTSGNKGNGFRLGKVFGHGSQLELRIPRDRQGEFKPLLLALFREQESYLREVSFDLYSKGLTTRDISDVLETIYGKHYSKSTISNFSVSFYDQMASWRERELESRYMAVYIDGLYVKVRRNGHYRQECYYIVLGLKEDYTREILAIQTLPNESAHGWQMVLKSLQDRGVNEIGLVVSDALSGLSEAIASVFPQSAHQQCIVHLQRNLQAMVHKADKKELAKDIRYLLNPDDQHYDLEQAINRLDGLVTKWAPRYKKLGTQLKTLPSKAYFTYLNYHYNIRRMIYTTNWIERFNKSARRTLKIRGGLPSEESALALITSVAIDKGDKTYKYPIYNFKFDHSLNKKQQPLI